MRRLLLVALTALFGTTSSYAQPLDELPEYKSEYLVHGEIRIWGSEAFTNVLRLWEIGFFGRAGGNQRFARFSDTLISGAAAIGSLYTGIADLGVMGHHCWPIETLGFFRMFGYPPLEIVVATGAYDVHGLMPGNVIFVHNQNPISRLTLRQLDGIFGSQRTGGWDGMNWSAANARSVKENIRTWGQLGLTGEWATKTINVYGIDVSGSSFSFSMQRQVFKGGDTWNPTLREYPISEVGLPGRPRKYGGDYVLEDLAKDPYGIAFATIPGAGSPGDPRLPYDRTNLQVKPVALAANDQGPYVEPTRESFRNRTYPLVESIYVYINRAPGRPVEPKLKEFLRYILSRQGQQHVADAGGFLPLTAEVVRQQLQKLE
jgi:phosphate transport system substrate-binding protein